MDWKKNVEKKTREKEVGRKEENEMRQSNRITQKIYLTVLFERLFFYTLPTFKKDSKRQRNGGTLETKEPKISWEIRVSCEVWLLDEDLVSVLAL